MKIEEVFPHLRDGKKAIRIQKYSWSEEAEIWELYIERGQLFFIEDGHAPFDTNLDVLMHTDWEVVDR